VAALLRPGTIIHSWLNRMLLPILLVLAATLIPVFFVISFPAGSGSLFGALKLMPLDTQIGFSAFKGSVQSSVFVRDIVPPFIYTAIKRLINGI